MLRSYSLLTPQCSTMLREYILEFICAGEEGTGVRANGNDLAVVGARKVHGGKNELAGNAASLKAIKDAGMVNDHSLQGGALVRHFAHLNRFGTCTFFGGSHPCLENAAFLGLLVLDRYHSCSISNNRFFISVP